MARKILLTCGILAMLWYIVVNIIIPPLYPGYEIRSQTVSELSAIDAPTQALWFWLCLPYTPLFIAFGFGIWLSANGNRKLQIVAATIIFDAILGLFWPPMNRREVLAAGGGTISDTLHLVWAFIHLALMLLMIGFGAAAFDRSFRLFSATIVLIFIVFGILTTMESDELAANLPTPYLGIWERINMAAYMLWVIVFAIKLLKRNTKPAEAWSL